MFKAIHSHESKAATREKAKQVTKNLCEMKLKAAKKNAEETFAYMVFPYEYWLRIHTNNLIERLNWEIRRRTRVVSAFPDGNSMVALDSAVN